MLNSFDLVFHVHCGFTAYICSRLETISAAFTAGDAFANASLDSCLQSYIRAEKEFNRLDRTIYNCTVNTKLNVFKCSPKIGDYKVSNNLIGQSTNLKSFLLDYYNAYSLISSRP